MPRDTVMSGEGVRTCAAHHGLTLSDDPTPSRCSSALSRAGRPDSRAEVVLVRVARVGARRNRLATHLAAIEEADEC
jgi:hypothetical protein